MVDSTDSAVAMWIETATPTQPICGLRIRTGLQTPSQTTLRSGLTPTGTASGITRNTTTDKRGARPIDLTAVERPLGRPRLIAGVAPMRTRTVGRTQHPHGSQARAARAMHGQRTQRSGTTPTVMDGGQSARHDRRCLPFGRRYVRRTLLRRRPLGVQGHGRRWLVRPRRCVHP